MNQFNGSELVLVDRRLVFVDEKTDIHGPEPSIFEPDLWTGRVKVGTKGLAFVH